MTEAEGNMSCSATPEVVRNQRVEAILSENQGGFEAGVFHSVLTDKDGNVLWEDFSHNGTTTEFAKQIWLSALPAATHQTVVLGQTGRLLKMGCFSRSSAGAAPTLSIADTYAITVGGSTGSFTTSPHSITTGTGWAAISYDPGAGTGGAAVAIQNSTAVAFIGSAQTNVEGAFIYTCNAADSGGTLVASALFGSPIASVASGDTLNVTFTATLNVS